MSSATIAEFRPPREEASSTTMPKFVIEVDIESIYALTKGVLFMVKLPKIVSWNNEKVVTFETHPAEFYKRIGEESMKLSEKAVIKHLSENMAPLEEQRKMEEEKQKISNASPLHVKKDLPGKLNSMVCEQTTRRVKYLGPADLTLKKQVTINNATHICTVSVC